jgi:hypothetical protein
VPLIIPFCIYHINLKTKAMSTEIKKIKGSDIKDIQTSKTLYDQDCIQLIDVKGVCYRLKVSQLHTLIGDIEFEVESKRVHTYLNIKTNS